MDIENTIKSLRSVWNDSVTGVKVFWFRILVANRATRF